MCCMLGFSLSWVNFLLDYFLMLCLQSFFLKEGKVKRKGRCEEGGKQLIYFFFFLNEENIACKTCTRSVCPWRGSFWERNRFKMGTRILDVMMLHGWWSCPASWKLMVRSWGCRTGVCLCQVSRDKPIAFSSTPWRHHTVVPQSDVCLPLVQQLAAWLLQ